MIRDEIVDQISERLQIAPAVVEKVVAHQFKEVAKALTIYQSVEVSGFGTFLFLKKKALLTLKEMQAKALKRERGDDVPMWAQDLPALQQRINQLDRQICHSEK